MSGMLLKGGRPCDMDGESKSHIAHVVFPFVPMTNNTNTSFSELKIVCGSRLPLSNSTKYLQRTRISVTTG